MPLVLVILFPHLDDIARALLVTSNGIFGVCVCVCVYIHVLLRSRATNAYSELWVNEVYDTFRCTRSLCGFESLREIERMVSIEMRNILLFISCLFFIRLSRRILSSPFKRVHRKIIQIYNSAAIFCLFDIKR